MILILIALIAATTLAYYGMQSVTVGLFTEALSCVFFILGIVSLIVYALFIFQYIAADHRTEIMNKEYESTYEPEDIYYYN